MVKEIKMSNKELNGVGIITLKSVYSKERKLIIMPAKDKRSGWYKGVARLSDEDKKSLKFWVDPTTMLTITHNMEFNMSDPVDKLNWEWVQHVNAIAMSFEQCQQSKEALFYVDSQEIESLKSVNQDMQLAKAMAYVFKDRDDLLADRGRLLGYDMSGESPTSIRETLLKVAKNPKTVHKLLEIYESTSVGINLLFLKARDKDIIKMNNGAYLYGKSILGVTEESVIAQMQDPANRQLVLEIEKELNSTLKAGKGKAAPTQKAKDKESSDEE